MKKSTLISVLCVSAIIFANAQQHDIKGLRPISIHSTRSIKNGGDSISIDQMVILKNKNLDFFIHDLQKSSLKLTYKRQGIPTLIQSFLESYSRNKFIIANPGEDWNCCDDNHDENKPDRQLICQGNDGHLFLISYLTGGVGEINHLILIQYQDDKIIDFWTGTLWKNLKKKDDIIQYLLTNKKKHWGLNTNMISI